jgi:hypothetical protein
MLVESKIFGVMPNGGWRNLMAAPTKTFCFYFDDFIRMVGAICQHIFCGYSGQQSGCYGAIGLRSFCGNDPNWNPIFIYADMLFGSEPHFMWLIT